MNDESFTAMEKTEFKTIDEYLALQTDEARITLESLRQTIRKAAPEAAEVIQRNLSREALKVASKKKGTKQKQQQINELD